MKKKNKFSIIIPVYNVEKYLKKCLDSVLNQTYQNYEVIIVCDKCDDKSEKIVDEYVKNNLNLTKIYAVSTGLSKARNIGVDASTGDYLIFLDSDDYIEKDLLDKLHNQIIDKEDIIRFQIREIFEDNAIEYNETSFDCMDGIKAFDNIIKYHYIENAWAYAYNSNFYKSNKFKFKENAIAEDYGLIPLIIAKAKKVKSLDYIGYNYVQRNNSLMNNNNYSKKVKKMDDMLSQSDELKIELNKIENTNKIIEFLNNSLIYYSTTLNKKDYKKYNRILKEKRCFETLPNKTFKNKFKKFIIKNDSWVFYHFIAR